MITASSRYLNNPVVLVESNRGPVVSIAPVIPQAKSVNFTYVRLAEGDRLDAIAATLFGDEGQWWRIADVNPEILDWFNLPVGTILRLPSGSA